MGSFTPDHGGSPLDRAPLQALQQPRCSGWSADAHVLLKAVEQSVVPRLRTSGRHDVQFGTKAVADAALQGQFEDHHIQEYLDALLSSELQAWDCLQRRVDEGATVPSICLHLLAPAARKLGELWESDVFTFADVTIAVGRLQAQLRTLCSTLPSEPLQDGPQFYHALFGPGPGEQHSLGLTMVSDFYRAAGWYVRIPEGTGPTALPDLLRRHKIDLLGLSVSVERHVEACAHFIQSCREASINRRLVVLVGGQLILQRPELVSDLGADCMGTDAREAMLVGFQLVASRKESR